MLKKKSGNMEPRPGVAGAFTCWCSPCQDLVRTNWKTCWAKSSDTDRSKSGQQVEEWRQDRAMLRPIMNGDSIQLYDIGEYPPTLMKDLELLPDPLNRTFRPGVIRTGQCRPVGQKYGVHHHCRMGRSFRGRRAVSIKADSLSNVVEGAVGRYGRTIVKPTARHMHAEAPGLRKATRALVRQWRGHKHGMSRYEFIASRRQGSKRKVSYGARQTKRGSGKIPWR